MAGMAAFLPPKAKSVLEFGCGKGTIGAEFLRIQPKARYFGVDPDENSLKEAANVLTRVFKGTVRTKIAGQKIDVIVYRGEMLRELTADILKAHKEILADDGQMLFIINNPVYLPNLMWRFAPDFKDSPKAAIAEISASVKNAGLLIERVIPVMDHQNEKIRNTEEAKDLAKSFKALGKRIGLPVDPADLWITKKIMRVVKKEPARKVFIYTGIGESIVTADMRVHTPNRFMNTEPGVVTLAEHDWKSISLAKLYPQRICLRQRIMYHTLADAFKQIENARQSGFVLVSEMDDSPVLWKDKYEATLNVDFVGCHAIQTSTPALAELLGKYNPHVRIFENCLSELPPPRRYDDDGCVKIFFGALNRDHEWQELMPVLNRVAEKYGEKVKFIVLSDKDFFLSLNTQHKEFVGGKEHYGGRFVPYDMYRGAIRRADISLLPLHDTEFNRMKSDLKFIESAADGATTLASPTVYDRTIKEGETGLIYKSVTDFEEKLLLLVEDRTERRRMAQNAYDYVRENRLFSDHYEERLAFYDDILQNFRRYDEELSERLSKLKQ